MLPPEAERIEKKFKIHNDNRSDPYFWLKEKKNPKVMKYLEDENEYFDFQMSSQKELIGTLISEMQERTPVLDRSISYSKNGYEYYTESSNTENYRRYYRKKHETDKVELILDVNEISKDYSYSKVHSVKVSQDNCILAYAQDTQGRNFYTIFLKNLISGETLNQKIAYVTPYFEWSYDGQYIYYVHQDRKTLRPNKVYRYELKTHKSVLVYEEKDAKFAINIRKTLSGTYMLINSDSTTTSEVRYLNIIKPDSKINLFQKRKKGVKYSISDGIDCFYILTNIKDSKNYKIMQVTKEKTTCDKWVEFCPHNREIFIENITVFSQFVVCKEKKNGFNFFKVIDRKNINVNYIKLEEDIYSLSHYFNESYTSDFFLFKYESLTTPETIYKYDMVKKELTLLRSKEILGGYNSRNYQSKRVFAVSEDGTEIPISIVYKSDKKPDRTNPGLIYAYGSYGETVDPHFSNAIVSLLDRGFVYAIAHVRGGSMHGHKWYEEGKLLKKKNTFNDFIAACHYLKNIGWIAHDKLFVSGESAGGMLMGCVINQCPDLFLGVNAGVPFVDVITTMMDEDIPLTTGEYEEWGNPFHKEFYDYMKSYSPYDQVKKQNYPNLLVTTSFYDSQVQYWEPVKWVAKLRYLKTDKNLMLLKINMTGGHGGASGIFDSYKETAVEYAFYLKLLEDRNCQSKD